MKWSLIIPGIAAGWLASGLALAGMPAHPGYPYNGKSADEYGKTAETVATKTVNEEFMTGPDRNELKAAEDPSRLGTKINKDDPRHPAHPGYPYR